MQPRTLILAAAFAAIVLASPAATPVRPPLLANGTVAPDFTALRPDNSEVKLSDFRGKVVLVDFWSTWCGPCKAAMPHLEKLHKKLYSVSGIPTFYLIDAEGKVAFSGVGSGAKTEAALDKARAAAGFKL